MFKSKKAVIAGLLSVCLALSCFIAAPVSVMAAGLSVYLDDEKLTYKDPEAQPQILNDRTMVPLRETAEYFGMEFTWNSETATMVFIGKGRTVIHTINSNTIYVNGQALEFDFTSAIINDRTMMPIRMLAEAIGCKVEWVGETATVNIYSEDYSVKDVSFPSTPAPTPTPTPVANASVSVFSATAESSSIASGEEAVIILSTNKAASKAKVTDGNGNIYDEITEYTEDSQGRYFTFYIPITEEGNNSLRVYAGNDSSYSASYKIVNITVGKAAEKIKVIAIDIDETELNDGDKVEGIVRTSKNADRIVIKDSDKKTIKSVTQSDYRGSDYRDWSFSFDIDLGKDHEGGKITYYVYAYDEDDNEASDSFSITVTEESAKAPVISRVSYYYEINGNSYDIIFTVRADKAAEEVELYDEDGDRITNQNEYSGSSARTFDLEYSTDIDSTVTYTVKVYGSNGKYSEEKIEVILD